MKIAVPSASSGGLEDKVGAHFGRTPTYTLFDEETREVGVVENTSHHMGGSGYPPQLLHDKGVEIMLCNSLGRKAVLMFESLGIDVYVGASGTVENTLKQYADGELTKASESIACDRHAFRDNHHKK
ncbi:MAG: dinitrogenase iron-molybdenum cofactor biosynthesis protein [Candidatus Altiarchaeales archaeon]|nr:dinitrogenase iron-molybdenum cofactor biosynthesis protein [Candidatus Altiarchaeales archaeon]